MFWTSHILTLWGSSLLGYRPAVLRSQGRALSARPGGGRPGQARPREEALQAEAGPGASKLQVRRWRLRWRKPVLPHLCFRSTAGSSVAQLGRSKHNGGRRGLTKGPAQVEDTEREEEAEREQAAEQMVPHSLPEGPLSPLAQRVCPGRHGTGRQAGGPRGLQRGCQS